MQEDDVPTKTEQGQNEISQRTRKLPPRQRTLLISINGNARVSDLRRQFGATADFDEQLRTLAEFGLIHLPSALKPAAPAPATVAPPASTPNAPAAMARNRAAVMRGDVTPGIEPAPSLATPADAAAPVGIVAAKQLMNETAFATLGLRAYMFTLKLEHCYSAEELRELLPDFEHLLSRAKGEEFASALIARLDHMLADAT